MSKAIRMFNLNTIIINSRGTSASVLCSTSCLPEGQKDHSFYRNPLFKPSFHGDNIENNS